jgi:hypothetical protein
MACSNGAAHPRSAPLNHENGTATGGLAQGARGLVGWRTAPQQEQVPSSPRRESRSSRSRSAFCSRLARGAHGRDRRPAREPGHEVGLDLALHLRGRRPLGRRVRRDRRGWLVGWFGSDGGRTRPWLARAYGYGSLSLSSRSITQHPREVGPHTTLWPSDGVRDDDRRDGSD